MDFFSPDEYDGRNPFRLKTDHNVSDNIKVVKRDHNVSDNIKVEENDNCYNYCIICSVRKK